MIQTNNADDYRHRVYYDHRDALGNRFTRRNIEIKVKLSKKSEKNRPVVLVRNRIGVCIDVSCTEGNVAPVVSPAKKFPELLLPFRGETDLQEALCRFTRGTIHFRLENGSVSTTVGRISERIPVGVGEKDEKE